MRDLALTEDGDLDFDVGTIDENQEIIQCLEIEFNSSLNEWFFDTNYGKEMSVFRDKYKPDRIEMEIIRIIANEERVKLEGGIHLDFNSVSRELKVSFTVRRIDNNELLGVSIDGLN